MIFMQTQICQIILIILIFFLILQRDGPSVVFVLESY